ncbi:hypothetical protein ACFSGI_09040 [Paenibacillus nicotianae]|uniref:Uncharacterized protein n=1 Tax=Paenibacillus nicotianae TaxID=1526551 RepID=A0ABW4UV43_9BACL
MKPIQYQQSQYQDVGGKQVPITIREFKGLNMFDPLSIDDVFFTDIVNMDSTNYPSLTTRSGYVVDYSVPISDPGASGVKGMFVFRLPDGTEELHCIFSDQTWRVKKGSTWRILPGQISGQSMSYQFATAYVDSDALSIHQTCLFMQSGGGRTYYYTEGQGTQVVSQLPENARYITSYQNRLWCVVDNELWASKLDDPLTWDINTAEGESAAYRRQIETKNGEKASALNGNFTRLTIGSPNTVQELYGGVPSQFNVQPVTFDTGPINMKSTITLDGIMYFVNKNGVYEYSGGTIPDKSLSEIINKLVKNVTQASTSNTDSFRVTGGTDGKKLFFYINDTFLVYDPRPGVQTWSKYSGIVPAHFAVFNNQLYIGDRQGRILRIEGNTDAGNAINWSAITKPFSNSSISQKLRWYKIFVQAEFTGTMNIMLSKTIDGDDFEQVGTTTGSGADVTKRIIIPVGKFARENHIRIKLTGSGYARIHEITRNQRQLPLY